MSTERQAGRELDAEVAEKVMGLVPCTASSYRNGKAPWSCHAQPESPDKGGETEPYSTDIAAAWQVVEKLHADGWTVVVRRVHDGAIAGAYLTKNGSVVMRSMVGEQADDAPTAICKAALAALASEGADR